MLVALVSLLAGGTAACGGSSPAGPAQPPVAKLEHIGASQVASIVLTALGAQRIGIQTGSVAALARRSQPTRSGASAMIPYAALVYEPDGAPVVYTNPSPGVFTRAPVSVAYIAGDSVYVSRGPAPGTRIVTVGAEELLGVENGVGVEN
jgi:hypothetical protein